MLGHIIWSIDCTYSGLVGEKNLLDQKEEKKKKEQLSLILSALGKVRS